MKNKYSLIIDKDDAVAVLTAPDNLRIRIKDTIVEEVTEKTAKEILHSIRNPKVNVKYNRRTRKIIEEKIKVKDIVETEDTPYNQDKPKQKKEI